MSSRNDNDPILTASDFVSYQRARGHIPEFPAPQAVIFAPQTSLADYVLRRHPAKRIKGFLGDLYLLKRTKGRIALSTGFGIGAPPTAALTDEFAALGVKQFALIGLAGGLQPQLTTGDLVIVTSAIRGEGVSSHYLSPAQAVDSSEMLVRSLSTTLNEQKQSHSLGVTWTTDAPFRELRKDVLEFQRQGVLTVEMEAAAVLAVAQATHCSAVAAFSIADQLTDGHWRMANDLRPAQRGLVTLVDAVIQIFLEN